MLALDTEKGESIDVLLWRLNDAIIWCSKAQPTNDLSQILRSDELAPWWWSNGRLELISRFGRQRRFQLDDRHEKIPAHSLAGGRLLIYIPDQAISDGLSQYATNGFFNIDSSPPWDTWVAYLYEYDENSVDGSDITHLDYLVSWIPPTYLELADKGVRANIEGCLAWFDDMKYGAARQLLRDRGIL